MSRIHYFLLALIFIYSCSNQSKIEEATAETSKEKTAISKPTQAIAPELLKYQDTDTWEVYNRKMTLGTDVLLHRGEEDGILWNKKEMFSNGTIEFDVKGRNEPGRNFVGLAFHIQDGKNYDAIYFRPFNFQSPNKSGNSLQYMTIPDNHWRKLRENHPGVYENPVNPVPDPTDWFHVKVEVNNPTVKVYVNDATEPSLVVDKLTTYTKGGVGFWVGYQTEGNFKNLKITHQ